MSIYTLTEPWTQIIPTRQVSISRRLEFTINLSGASCKRKVFVLYLSPHVLREVGSLIRCKPSQDLYIRIGHICTSSPTLSGIVDIPIVWTKCFSLPISCAYTLYHGVKLELGRKPPTTVLCACFPGVVKDSSTMILASE
jgi:hypothetical protein